ncbi:hypothetical protein [Streptomyces sp. CMB-StM0423]|nr:hypothetical protein [Streptomyces sp. CMB-StM0423]
MSPADREGPLRAVLELLGEAQDIIFPAEEDRMSDNAPLARTAAPSP